MRLLLLPLLCICFFSAKIFAQENPVELSTIVVTANLQEQQQKESGRNIVSIKGEYFKSLPVHSVDEMLRYLPGVEVQQRGPQGAQSDIVIRGGTFQQVLVIIDGIKLNDPLTGHFNSYIPINAAEIERVEVLKGAASAIYGSEAVGGVINIITKTFYRKNVIDKNAVTGKLAAGEYRLINGELYGRWSDKKTILSAGLQTNNADGPPLRGTSGFFHATNASIAFSQSLPKNWILNFRSAIDNRKFNAQNFYTSFASDTAHEKVNSWWNHLYLTKQFSKGQLHFDAGFKKLRDQFWFRPNAAPNDNKTNLFSSQVYYSSPAAKKFGFTSGVQFLRKEIQSNDRGNHQLWHGALYSILRQKLKNNFFINESLRLDWDENYGVILVPQINFSWTPSKITLRGSAGRSFRDADFTERYNNYNKALVTGGSIGNPDLKPETSWNFEAGADYFLTNELSISSTLFYRHHQNLIDWTPTPYADMPRKTNLVPNGNYALAKNIEEVKTTGVELDLQYRKQLNKTTHLYASMGYTWLQSKNDDPVPSFYISSHAKNLLNFAAILHVKSFTVSLNGLYKNRNEQKANSINAAITKSYFVLNSKLAFQLPKKYGRLFLQVDNIFDKIYSDLLGAQMPGRWLSGGFEIAL